VVCGSDVPCSPLADVQYARFPVVEDEQLAQNIIRYLPELMRFIDAAREKAHGVLLLDSIGTTRSPTLAAAYLIHKDKLSAQEAIARVAQVSDLAVPLACFVEQLTIWAAMGASIVPMHPGYRRLVLQQQTAQEHSYLNEDPDASRPPETQPLLVYTCRACRKRLFLSDAIIGHEFGVHNFDKKKGAPRPSFANGRDCTSWWIETYRWMGPLNEIEGKLLCPKCSARVGSYHWAGMQCSCGTWVRPAFQVVKSKVDEVPFHSMLLAHGVKHVAK